MTRKTFDFAENGIDWSYILINKVNTMERIQTDKMFQNSEIWEKNNDRLRAASLSQVRKNSSVKLGIKRINNILLRKVHRDLNRILSTFLVQRIN